MYVTYLVFNLHNLFIQNLPTAALRCLTWSNRYILFYRKLKIQIIIIFILQILIGSKYSDPTRFNMQIK